MTQPASTPTPTPTPPTPTPPALDAETAKWLETFKGEDPEKVRKSLDHAREWEKRAKDNADAAKRLAEIEEAQKTEAQKAAERLQAIEDRATAAERRAVRSEIIAEFKLDKDDAKALEHIESEDEMRQVAERLAAKAEQRITKGNRVPVEGRTQTRPGDDPMRNLAQNVFGREE